MAVYAVQSPTYQPAMRIISAITNAEQASITTSFGGLPTNHDYITGEIVKFFIPLGFGIQQLHDKKGTITVTGATTFTVDINTSLMDPFIAVPTNYFLVQQSAQVIPIGEISSMLRAAVKNVLLTGSR